MVVGTSILCHLVFRSCYWIARADNETALGRSGRWQKEKLHGSEGE